MLQLQFAVVSTQVTQPPELVTEVPGPRSRELAARLARVESRNVTCLEPGAPIFWERAAGANVWDVDGNRFVDLTSGFGVTNAGHGHPRVVEAICDQADRLLHAMGDVHPAAVKVQLLEALARLYPGGVSVRGVLTSSGADAVETALKTALVATGRAGVIAFEGAYHGLALGALDTTWSARFRDPFAARLAGATRFARYGDIDAVRGAASTFDAPPAAVLVEPIQGRGGNRIPPEGFLADLRALCDDEGWLLTWPASDGEALHTQTFLGHPPGCAAALACIAVMEEQGLVERAASNGAAALGLLERGLAGRPGVRDVRGRGLLLGVECDDAGRVAAACDAALARGVIALPCDDTGRVLSLTPPLSIEPAILKGAIEIVAEALG
jgi:4-aminobutyrate aminotransferase/(S)-3-amino-2-methylpropionate transaminase